MFSDNNFNSPCTCEIILAGVAPFNVQQKLFDGEVQIISLGKFRNREKLRNTNGF